MSQFDFLLADKLMDTNVDETLRWVDERDRLRQAGLLRPPWLSRQYHRRAYQLGGLLVALGERMKRDRIPQPPVLDGQMSQKKPSI